MEIERESEARGRRQHGLVEPRRVNELAELAGDVGDEAVRKLLVSFENDAAGRLERLWDACASGEAETAIRAAHTLKGVALGLGAPRLAALSLRAEQAARAGDLETLRRALPALGAAIVRSSRAFSAALFGPARPG